MIYKIIAQQADGPEAAWQVSAKVNATTAQPTYQTSDLIFEADSVPTDFKLQQDGTRLFLESEGASRSEIQSGDLGSSAFEFLVQALKASQKTSRAIKLVSPRGSGNIIRSTILPKRLHSLEYIENSTAFAEPLQVFSVADWTDSTTLNTLFKESLGGIRLQEASGTQTNEELLATLGSELPNRLSIPLLASGLKRKTIVILEGGDALPFGGVCSRQLYEAASSLGIDVVVLAVEGHTLQSSEYAHWRKEFIPLECGYDDAFPSRIVAAVKSYNGTVDGILTIQESYHIFLSAAAKELGLPHEPVSAYEIATNKYKLSEFEGRNSFIAANAEEAVKIAQTQDVPWPIIIKPCRGWASELVFKIDNIDQLREAAPRMDSDRHGASFVMEHYCEGPEVDINFVLYNGEVVFWGKLSHSIYQEINANTLNIEMGDENPKSADTGEESFGELDYCLPSELPKTEQTAVYDAVLQTLTKLGFRNGMFHCEARVDNSSMEWRNTAAGVPEMVPRATHNGKTPASWLIEINTRPAGLNTCDIVETTWGVDYFTLLLLTKLEGATESVQAMSKPYLQGAQYFADMIFVLAQFDKAKEGIWRSGNATEELAQRRPDIAKHFSGHYTFPKDGDKIPHPSSGINRFVAYMHLFSRESRAHVLELAAEARRELRMDFD